MTIQQVTGCQGANNKKKQKTNWNRATQMDPPCATCRFATRNGASQQTQCAACGRHANRQTTVCFQSDPHVADRMLLSHRTSRSEAVNALKLQLTAGAPPTSCVTGFFCFVFFKSCDNQCICITSGSDANVCQPGNRGSPY